MARPKAHWPPRGGEIRAPITTFVGRRREIGDVKAALAEARLVTLTGPGGVGKTRLALEVAGLVCRSFQDGAWLVELSDLGESTGGTSLESRILEALPIVDQSHRAPGRKLLDALHDRELLLVLDNCEHLTEPVARLIAKLLSAAAGLRVLATGRAPLGIAGERLREIAPLATPAPDRPHSPQGLERYEAVSLFADRARSIDPGFTISDANAVAVALLLQQLDGVPLAIELAATRLRTLSVAQIVERLDRRFQLLVKNDPSALPRQQSLRALIDWSFDLCGEVERCLWARLSVFPASFDLEAAESVCGFGEIERGTVLDVLDRLVAKSVVQTERSSDLVRYKLLVTVREYGAQHLAADEAAHARRRHRDHFARRVREIAARWFGPGQATALASLRRDHANLIAALEWSASNGGDSPSGIELASGLAVYWIAGGLIGEGRRWLERLLAERPSDDEATGNACWSTAWIALLQGDLDGAEMHVSRCEALATSLSSDRLRAHAVHWSGLLRLLRGEPAAAAAALDRARHAHREAGDAQSASVAQFMLGCALVYDGDVDRALELSQQMLAETGPLGERWIHGYCAWVAGICHWKRGDLDAAEHAVRTTLEIHRDFQDWSCVALTIELATWIAVSRADYSRAAELAEASDAAWDGLGMTIAVLGPGLGGDSKAMREALARELGRGRHAKRDPTAPRLSRPEAIAVALGTPAARAAPDRAETALSKRELEIAGLVAQGLSNRAIAERLFLSVRTVDGHLERILAKLDFKSRAQIAAWVADRRGA